MRKEKFRDTACCKCKEVTYLIAAVCLLGMAIFCGCYLYGHYSEQREQTKAFEEIAAEIWQLRENGAKGEDGSFSPLPNGTGTAILPEYAELFRKNPDMVGWIWIEGTTIDYPVVQTPDNPNYYLEHGFDKEYSKSGTPYVQEDCDVDQIFLAHKALWLGMLEDLKASAEAFLDGMDGTLLQGFCRKFLFSFLQRLRSASPDPPSGAPGQLSGST